MAGIATLEDQKASKSAASRQHREDPVDELHRFARRAPEGREPAARTGTDDGPTELQARRTRDHDRGQLEGAVTDHEREEGLLEAEMHDMRSDPAEQQAVHDEDQDAAEAEQDSAGEGAEGDADIVHDVVAEHEQVVGALAILAEALRKRVVHRLEVANALRVEQAVDQLRRRLDQREEDDAGHQEEERRSQERPAIPAHRAWKLEADEAQHATLQTHVLRVEHAMATERELIQAIEQAGAVATLGRDGEIPADLEVALRELRELRPQLARRLRAAESLDLREKRLELAPAPIVLGLEDALLHDSPAIPFATRSTSRIASASRAPVSGSSTLAISAARSSLRSRRRSA